MSPIQQVMFKEKTLGQWSEASYNDYLETSRDALLLVSAHGTILRSNKRFARLSLYSTVELCDQNISDLFYRSEESTPLLPLHTTMLNRPLLTLTMLMRQKTGTEKAVEIFICPVGPDAQDLSRYQILIKKSLSSGMNNFSQQTGVKASWLKSIGALAGGIAHNFNNIMTSLYGNITLAKLEARDNPKILAHLGKAESSMEDAVKLTRQLLTFAKGGSPLKEHFNPEPLIRDIAGLNLTGSDITVNLTAPKDLWLIHADRNQLEQVVANIVVNARHAMADKGELFIKLTNSHQLKDNLLTISKGAYIKMVFRDQGCGIPAKNINRIFDPYYTTRQDSCGMGLSICYSIISRHNGHISAASQIGEGTVITLYLPAQAQPDVKAGPFLSSTSPPNSRERILIMDDEKPVRDITKKILEKSGYEVNLAREGEQAVDMYARALGTGVPYDLVIMDITVPTGMGGQAAAAKILEINPSARLALTSGHLKEPVISDPEAFGFKGTISKPYSLEELTRSVRKMLDCPPH